jgi:hypothetical protein
MVECPNCHGTLEEKAGRIPQMHLPETKRGCRNTRPGYYYHCVACDKYYIVTRALVEVPANQINLKRLSARDRLT